MWTNGMYQIGWFDEGKIHGFGKRIFPAPPDETPQVEEGLFEWRHFRPSRNDVESYTPGIDDD